MSVSSCWLENVLKLPTILSYRSSCLYYQKITTMKILELTLTTMTTMRRYVDQSHEKLRTKCYLDQIASLQSRDQPCRQETGHSERLSLRLPPLTEDESSVYSYAEGITNARLSLERKHRRSTRPDDIRTPWRSGRRG